MDLIHADDTVRLGELPIRLYKNEIIKMASENQILVVHGETGSGKTTQIPQYLLEAELNDDKVIGITQPRKIGAVNMAKRVAEEMNCPLGKEVGYEIRFDNKSGASTKIKYMTDGILLNHCVNDRNLSDYGVIIIDEAHERVLRSDVLLGMLKEIVTRKTDLKLIIASATLDSKKFSRYFTNAPIIKIEGSIFDINVSYLRSFPSNYKEEAVQIIRRIQEEGDEGDILVFLTGREEIENCIEKLEGCDGLAVLPLYSAMEYDEQQKIFEPVGPGQRKVIVSTNIAETSITIEGIRHVIDCGYVKQTNYNATLKMEIWEDVKISQAQADQRKGRAGRTAPGSCYRLYSERDYSNFLPQAKPEMARKNLSEIYLKVHAFGLNPLEFEFIDPPNQEALLSSQSELKELNFITKDGELTPDGMRMLDLPVDPMIGKVLLASIDFRCIKRMVVMLATLTEESIFKVPRYRREEESRIKRFFNDEDGDPFTLYNVFQKWMENNKSEKWCKENFIDAKVMETVDLVQNQLGSIVRRMLGNVEVIEDLEHASVKKSIISGFYSNVCRKVSNFGYERIMDGHKMFIHPSSSLFNVCPDYVLYFSLKKQKKVFMFQVMKVDIKMLKEFPLEMRKIGLK